jgi:hypothetical protein
MYVPAYAAGSAQNLGVFTYVNGQGGSYFQPGDSLRVNWSATLIADPNTNTEFRLCISWDTGRSVIGQTITVAAGTQQFGAETDQIVAEIDHPYYPFSVNVEWRIPGLTLWTTELYDWGQFDTD